jgi:hypothetical protein
MAPGSRLVAHGSWLKAYGSWLMVHGSWFINALLVSLMTLIGSAMALKSISSTQAN